MSLIGENLIRLVRKFAAETPDYIYEPPRVLTARCVYVHNGKPSCLIGKALWELGLINSTFETSPKNSIGIADIYMTLGLALDAGEIKWLTNAQAAQDYKKPWSRAVDHADALSKGWRVSIS
ncbi:hypothetical protein SEA_AEGEUS_65 [Mycobacterium phage Aegeus]|nr:hypothetical protein SEA_BAUDELAIRE_65 [Mycobacterium phage Baudelaire]WKW86557.1 hypothetical protein SEA_AEGEUS_65 [Mycobacterium phage Aegeus]